MQIGALSRALGRPDLARDYFNRFYTEFPRDYRHYMLGELLRELEAGR